MSLYVLRWNPKKSAHTKEIHLDLVNHLRNGETPDDFSFEVTEYEKVKADDIFIMQQIGTKNDGIVMVGKFKGACYKSNEVHKDGKKKYSGDLWVMDAFDADSENPLPATRYEKLFPKINWHEGHSGVRVEDDLAVELMTTIEKDLIEKEIWKPEYFKRFMEWDFLSQAMNTPPASEIRRPTPEELEDGKMLVTLKQRFFSDPKEETYFPFLMCLADSVLLVPTVFEGENIFAKTLTKEDGETGFPVFSNYEQAEFGDQEVLKGAQLVPVPFMECITLSKTIENCNTIVLDPFSQPFAINDEICQTVLQIKEEMDKLDES